MVTVPVRGIRLHQQRSLKQQEVTSYCPREGYKVASIMRFVINSDAYVTVPVRGIRLHPKLFAW